jgi:hypothetical protein
VALINPKWHRLIFTETGMGGGGVDSTPLKVGGNKSQGLVQILPTSTLDYIFDDSGEKILWRTRTGLQGWPKIAKNPKIMIFARDKQL